MLPYKIAAELVNSVHVLWK